MNNQIQNILISFFLIVLIGQLIDDFKVEAKQQVDSEIKPQINQQVEIKQLDKENLNKEQVSKEIQKLNDKFKDVEKQLSYEIDSQVDEYLNNQVVECIKQGDMSESVMNILSAKLEPSLTQVDDIGSYDPYSPSSAMFGKEDENQIKYDDLPNHFNMREQHYKPLSKINQKDAPKPIKSYQVDGVDYYNPSCEEKFGDVMPSASGNYHPF